MWRSEEQDDGDRNRKKEPPNDRLAGETVCAALITSADGLRNEDGGADVDRGENRNDEKNDLEPDAHAGDGGRAEPSHHQRVDRADGSLQQVLADNGRCQAKHPALRHRFGWNDGRLRHVLWNDAGTGDCFGGFEAFVAERGHCPSQAGAQSLREDGGYTTVLMRSSGRSSALTILAFGIIEWANEI